MAQQFQPHPSHRLAIRFWGPSLLVLFVLMVASFASVTLLNAVRGYTSGQSLWSQAREQAADHLRQMALRRDPTEYTRFTQALRVIEGDHLARVSMLRSPPDWDAARQGFRAGGNHPDDIGGMVAVFVCCHDMWVLKEPEAIWSGGDVLIDQLRDEGLQLLSHVQQGSPETTLMADLARIDALNQKLMQQEQRFAQALGVAGRQMQDLMLAGLAVVALSLGLACIAMFRRTVRQEAEKQDALALANQQWEVAASSADLGYFELDVRTLRYAVDARTAALHGLPAEPGELTREQARAQINEADRERVNAAINDTLTSGVLYKVSYDIVRDSDGPARRVEATGRISPDGRRLIGAARDISDEHKRAQLAAERDAAERIAQSQRMFLSRLSHELRTPLNAILGFAQLLSMGSGGELSPSQSRQMGLITTAGRQLLALIEDVLDLSKVESGEVGLNLHAVDIDPVLETCMEMLSPMCAQAGVSVNLQRASPLPLVQADPQRLLQIFMNLASNACKYNRPGGTLDIQLRQEGEDVVIHFIDSGQGVPPGELSELFQPFRRSHVHNHIEGSGLGLYIVKQLVDRMGGRITAESTWGEGSRFSVHLPAMAALQHPSAQAA